MNSFEAFAALVGRDERVPLPLLEAAAQVRSTRIHSAIRRSCSVRLMRGRPASGAHRPGCLAADALSPAEPLLLRRARFAAARDDYDAVENSFLHRVIKRRRGIPITLSLLYVELGRAAGLCLDGVSFPGHFLVRLTLNDAAVFIDVFNGGVSLSDSELRGRLAQALPDVSETRLAPTCVPPPIARSSRACCAT